MSSVLEALHLAGSYEVDPGDQFRIKGAQVALPETCGFLDSGGKGLFDRLQIDTEESGRERPQLCFRIPEMPAQKRVDLHWSS